MPHVVVKLWPAIQEQLNGKVVDWMEKVSDKQYRG